MRADELRIALDGMLPGGLCAGSISGHPQRPPESEGGVRIGRGCGPGPELARGFDEPPLPEKGNAALPMRLGRARRRLARWRRRIPVRHRSLTA